MSLRKFVLAFVVMAIIVSPASAGLITYNFSGTVTSISGTSGVSELDNAASFTGTFSYEDTTAGAVDPFAPPPSTTYLFPTGTMTVLVDTGLTFENTGASTADIALTNDIFLDAWMFNAAGGIDETVGGSAAALTAFQMQTNFFESTGNAIVDETTLIGQDLSLANFPGVPDPQTLYIAGNSGGGIWELRADFTSMSVSAVPEPGSFGVLALACCGLGFRRRRKPGDVHRKKN